MLHTVNRSPFESRVLETCLRYLDRGDALLLYEDGVYAALAVEGWAERLSPFMPDVRVHVLQADLLARGLGREQLADGVEPVDYGGFVDLVAAHSPLQCWR